MLCAVGFLPFRHSIVEVRFSLHASGFPFVVESSLPQRFSLVKRLAGFFLIIFPFFSNPSAFTSPFFPERAYDFLLLFLGAAIDFFLFFCQPRRRFFFPPSVESLPSLFLTGDGLG